MNDATPRSTGRGPARAPLSADGLAAAAGPAWDVLLLSSAESTNALAAARAEPGLVVVADHQTAGRGRLGRAWVTPPGAALTFSAVVDPAVDDEWWPLLPLVAGTAVAAAVHGALKWPNDVLIGGAKVCGILVERVQARGPGRPRPLAVVGVGLNVDQAAEELPVETATSLALAGRPRDRTELLGQVLAGLEQGLATLASSPGTAVAAYRASCDTLGREVRVELPDGGLLRGLARDVDDHGRLVVEGPEGRRVVSAGDVVHVRPEG